MSRGVLSPLVFHLCPDESGHVNLSVPTGPTQPDLLPCHFLHKIKITFKDRCLDILTEIQHATQR